MFIYSRRLFLLTVRRTIPGGTPAERVATGRGNGGREGEGFPPHAAPLVCHTPAGAGHRPTLHPCAAGPPKEQGGENIITVNVTGYVLYEIISP